MIQGMDHYAYTVLGRDDIEEDVVYYGTGAERVIPNLRPGDRVRLSREGVSYPQIEATVVDHNTDYVTVMSGVKYDLWASWDNGVEWGAWLRRDGRSEGQIRHLTVLELVDDE